MGKQRSPQQGSNVGTADASTGPRGGAPKKSVTPPKGRPTRARSSSGRRKRAFGPVAQWVTVGAIIALVVVVIVLVTDGGDFNPFDDEQLPSQFGAPAASAVRAA